MICRQRKIKICKDKKYTERKKECTAWQSPTSIGPRRKLNGKLWNLGQAYRLSLRKGQEKAVAKFVATEECCATG